MYSIETIKSCIKLYFQLSKNKIIGKKREQYIKDVFNIHMNTLYNWIKLYYNKQTNLFDFSTFKTNFKYNNTKITADIEQFIISSLDSNNRFNIKKIKNSIFDKFKIKFSKPTIYHIIHKHNYTFKNTTDKNIPYDDDKIKEMKNDLKNKIINIDKNKIISYDEFSVYLNDSNTKGWSKKGEKCIIKTKNKTIFNKRYTVGMSINLNGKIDFTIVEKALKSDKFNTFMNKICNKENFIFMDNASIHKNKNFKNNITKNNYNIIYNIPYHSHLNPIEYIFSLLRRELLNNDVKTVDDIIKIILIFSKNLNIVSVKNIFKKCMDEILI